MGFNKTSTPVSIQSITGSVNCPKCGEKYEGEVCSKCRYSSDVNVNPEFKKKNEINE